MAHKRIAVPASLLIICLCVAAYAIRDVAWDQVEEYYGQAVRVKAKIVYTNNTGKACFLSVDRNWKRNLTAVIYSADFDKFPADPEDYYLNKLVQITGIVRGAKGRPEIVLKDPGQIVVIGTPGKDTAPEALAEDIQTKIELLENDIAALRLRIGILEAKVNKLEKLLPAESTPTG